MIKIAYKVSGKQKREAMGNLWIKLTQEEKQSVAGELHKGLAGALLYN